MLSIAARYRTFQRKEELNQLITELLKRYGRFLRTSCKTLIKFFARHSVKVLGVSFPGVKYILDKAGISKATYYRAIARLEAIGFIKIIKVGGESIFQIQSQLDWNRVEHVLVGPIHETVNETPHETVDKSDEVNQDKVHVLWESGLSLPSFSAIKIHDFIREHFPTIGYNWLESRRE